MTTSITLEGRVVSKKNSRILNFRKGRRISLPSTAYRQFEEACLWQLKKYKHIHEGLVSVDIIFHLKGEVRIDIDNAVSSIFDVIQKSGIIPDDNSVVRVFAAKKQGFKNFETTIIITDLTN